MKRITGKLIAAFAIVLFAALSASAQIVGEPQRTAKNTQISSGLSYQQGTKVLSLGVGLGSAFLGTGLEADLPPIGLSFEYGVSNKISAGAYAGVATASPAIIGIGEFNMSYFIIAARGSYHFLTSEKLDPYAGIFVGYNNASVSASSSTFGTITASASGGIWGIHAGTRYYFTENVGAFGELGTGIAYLTLGGSLKF